MNLVSIIIPTWNAEEYLRATLRSVEAQTHRNLQVLIVDDESSDASPFIAGQFAENDSRFTHIRQANRGPGPGGGRNGGLPYVEGEWIFFLDADDLLPPDAIEKLVAVGSETGSDIVTGSVARFRNSSRSWPTPNHMQSHRVALRQTHIRRHPVLAYDSTAWNKIYRTAFWNGAGRLFPERKLFEDINPITRAHCESASTDVITDPVYLWRIRDDQSSITQQVADKRTFEDKIEQMTLAHEYLCQEGLDEVRVMFEQKSLLRDFSQGVDEIAHGDDDYAKMVCSDGAQFLDRMLPSSIETLSTRDQLKFYLCRQGRVDDLRDVVTGAHEASNYTIAPLGSGASVTNDFASALRPPVPDHLTVDDAKPALTLSRVFVRWGDDDDLVISATATIDELASHLGRIDRLSLRCMHPVHGFSVPIEPKSLTEGGIRGLIDGLQVDRSNRSVRLAFQGRFSVHVPLSQLRLADDQDWAEWRFAIDGVAKGAERRTVLPKLNNDRLPRPSEHRAGDQVFEFTVSDHVRLGVSRAT